MMPLTSVITLPSTQDERHKIAKNLWPLDEFPRFVRGGAYLVGRPALLRLFQAAKVTPVLPLEHVYVTGLCSVGGKVELIQNKRYTNQLKCTHCLMNT